MDADYGRGHGSIIHPIIINYYCLIQTVYTVLNINDSNKKMVSYEYTEQTHGRLVVKKTSQHEQY